MSIVGKGHGSLSESNTCIVRHGHAASEIGVDNLAEIHSRLTGVSHISLQSSFQNLMGHFRCIVPRGVFHPITRPFQKRQIAGEKSQVATVGFELMSWPMLTRLCSLFDVL